MTDHETQLVVTSETRLADAADATEKLDQIKRLALRHNSQAVNIGAHRLAQLILKVIRQ